jgi:hypothetical protein
MAAMTRFLALVLLAASVTPAAARLSLVCRVTARIPYTAAISPDFDNTRVFTQVAELVEERRSGNSLVHQWTVIADTPDQIRAIDPVRALTLTIDLPGYTFAESGVQVQRRGYCWANDLP